MDWHSAEVIYRSTQMLQLASYTAFGMFILDFLTSLDFDLAIITGKKRFRLTFVPYLLARYSTLAAKITNILLFNAWSATGDDDCARWVTVNYSLYVVSYSCSLLLALLRVVALSDNNWKYGAPLAVFYLVTVSLASYADSRIEGYFIKEAYACAIGNTVVARFYVYLVAAFDFSCLGVMFLILMRQRGATLWRLLFTQGLQYLAIASIAYIPSMILISLNLNDPLNVLPDTLAVVMICIAMQRMYRQLVEFGSSESPYPTRGPIPSVSAPPVHGYPWAPGGSRPVTGVAGINILVEEHKMVDNISQYSQSGIHKSKDDLRSGEYGEV